jgi:hypothetical protein
MLKIGLENILRRLGPDSLKWLVRIVISLVIFTIASIIWLFLEAAEVRDNALSSIIDERCKQISIQFDNFFEPILLDLQALREMGQAGILDEKDVNFLSSIVLPIVRKYPKRISGFMLADSLGSEFKLIRSEGKWEVVKSDYDPRTRPWFRDSEESTAKGEVYWTNVYEFHTKKQPAITVSVPYLNVQEAKTNVIAFDIVLQDIAEFVSTLKIGTEGRLFLIQEPGVINFSALPKLFSKRVSLEDLTSNLESGDEIIALSLEAMSANGVGKSTPVRFNVGTKKWWMARAPFDYGKTSVSIGLSIPEEHLMVNIRTPVKLLFAVMFVMLAVFAVVLLLFLRGQYMLLREALVYPGYVNRSEEEILNVIKEGENSQLEFKSTLRWNLRENRPGREIENSCVKTMVGFMNSRGGTLLVGVEDEGRILGIESDNFPNEDKFLLHFNNLVARRIGLEFSKYISFSIKKVNRISVFVVDCQKSDKPVFLRDKDAEDFYLRVGPATRKLSTREVLKHLRSSPEVIQDEL